MKSYFIGELHPISIFTCINYMVNYTILNNIIYNCFDNCQTGNQYSLLYLACDTTTLQLDQYKRCFHSTCEKQTHKYKNKTIQLEIKSIQNSFNIITQKINQITMAIQNASRGHQEIQLLNSTLQQIQTRINTYESKFDYESTDCTPQLRQIDLLSTGIIITISIIVILLCAIICLLALRHHEITNLIVLRKEEEDNQEENINQDEQKGINETDQSGGFNMNKRIENYNSSEENINIEKDVSPHRQSTPINIK